MFLTKEKYQILLDTLENNEKRIQNLYTHIIELNERVKELESESAKKPDYFG